MIATTFTTLQEDAAKQLQSAKPSSSTFQQPSSSSQQSTLQQQQQQSSASASAASDVIKKEVGKIHCEGLRLVLIDDLTNLHLPIFDFGISPFDIHANDWTTMVNSFFKRFKKKKKS